MKTVREFAERVLFGATLQEKLAPLPPGLVDEERGNACLTPDAPGRPEELILRRDGVRAEFPGTGKIATEGARGKLLHFFANHELLATELMALVLLKFPDAPGEFRAGVLQTLREEQMHTKLYLRRMEECGVTFGELPVNGFFWNLVSPMETPLDYVTRLSLTFEQANLDYSRGYARAFAEVGDVKTAALLERIYRDEINHVHYGLHWFRRWKEQKSDWKSYCSLLNLPLSAARAKGGFEFNEEGRKKAGLNEEFIRELKVYARSKGRTPNVYWFNPGAEESLSGRSPDRMAFQVTEDLELLMAFLARREDVVMLETVPSSAYVLSLVEAGLEVPELMPWSAVEEVAGRKLGSCRPWAKTPDAQVAAGLLGLPCKVAHKSLFSKLEHAKFLTELLERSDWSVLCGPDLVGQEVASLEALEEWRSKSAWGQYVLKSPFSTAGRDRLFMRTWGELTAREAAWVEQFLQQERLLLVEPWVERVLDCSYQYDVRKGGELVRRGCVVLENSTRGQFRRARVTGRIVDQLDEESRRLIFSDGGKKGGLTAWLESVFEPALRDYLVEEGFEGPVGVDAMFYRDLNNDLRFKPVVEVNPRYTMGRVAVELDRFRNGKGVGVLSIQRKGERPPVRSVCLTPVQEETRLVAYWSVEEESTPDGVE